MAELGAPSLVVGLGGFGAEVARRLAREAAQELRDPSRGELEVSDWAELVRAEGLDLVLDAPDEEPEALARRVVDRARGLLAHSRLTGRRDAPGRDGPTRLHVLVLGNLGEPEVRDRLGPVLSAMERALLRAYGPIFEHFRVHDRRALVVLPLLAMPHPAAHDDGPQIVAGVRDLLAQLTATPPTARAVPQIYVIEDVAEFSVLSEAELGQNVRNFATLILYGFDALDDAEGLLYGRDPNEPLATFACAVAELPRAALRRYGVNRVALEVLDAIAQAPRRDTSLRRLDVLEDVELAALDWEDTSHEDVRAVLDRYAPPIERDPEPRWWVRTETLRERYGPDHGDVSSDAPQPAADPPVGWALERMRGIEETWRLLQRRRFDDLIAGERRAIEERRDALVERIEAMVDATLWRDPTPEGFRETAERVEILHRAVDERLAHAVAIRDAIAPPGAPSFDAFRTAHGKFLDEVRRKPDLGRMLLYGGLAVTACVALGPSLLRALADATGSGAGDALDPWLRARAGWTSLALGLLLGALPLALRFHARVRALRTAFAEMWRALQDTVTGPEGSLLDYFASRLRLARQVARVEALLAVRAALDQDRERLHLLDRAVDRARARLLDEQRRLGVERDPEGKDRLDGLFDRARETLVEPMVGPEAAERLRTLLPAQTRRVRIHDVLQTLARTMDYARRWRAEIPFTDLDALRSACAPHAQPVADWDPTRDPGGTDALADSLAAFVRRQARTLHVALNYSGHEASDPTGLSHVAEALVPARLREAVRQRLQDEGAAGPSPLPVRPSRDRDRAYYVLSTSDIASAAVPSLAPLPDRFEVEGDA